MVTLETLSKLAEWMLAHDVLRLRTPDGLELELRPTARRPAVANESPVPAPSVFADVDGAGVCSCGHSWLDHTEAGCIRGCSWQVCTSEATAEPEGES